MCLLVNTIWYGSTWYDTVSCPILDNMLRYDMILHDLLWKSNSECHTASYRKLGDDAFGNLQGVVQKHRSCDWCFCYRQGRWPNFCWHIAGHAMTRHHGIRRHVCHFTIWCWKKTYVFTIVRIWARMEKAHIRGIVFSTLQYRRQSKDCYPTALISLSHAPRMPRCTALLDNRATLVIL